MSKGTTIKEALAKFIQNMVDEICQNVISTESGEVVQNMLPSTGVCTISKFSSMIGVKHLSLSTNTIEKIANLNGLRNLKILSLARNNIKSLTGLEAVGDTLEELWISYNAIEKLKGINVLKKLRVLYMVHNRVSEWNEFNKLGELGCLESLTFGGNPLHTSCVGNEFMVAATTKLKKLKHVDGVAVARLEPDDQQQQQQ